MSKGELAKEKLIRESAILFWKNGYHNTGISDILKAAGMTKGSFYFYFNGKEDLASAVISFYEKTILQMLEQELRGCTWEDFCDRLIDIFTVQLQDYEGFGCPLAVLGLELTFTVPQAVPQYQQALENVRLLFLRLLKASKVPEKFLDETSALCLSVFEGNLVLYRINQDPNQMRIMQRELRRAGSMYR